MIHATTEESIVPEIVTWLRAELAPRFAVERILGTGGMGTVFRATDTARGRRVAIKVMHRELVLQVDSARRFAREARAAASMTSEHVARIYEVDATPSGVPFMVMEHLEGLDLGQLLSRRRPITTDDAIRWIVEATFALEEAHALGLVHRDLKPENLFLTSEGAVKVLDFGLAKNVTPTTSGPPSQTREGALLGSPLYMAPEQVRAVRSLGPATDIWGLGATLYHLLAGTPPFNGPTMMFVCARILSDAPLPVPGLPAPLSAVLGRCLEKEPKRRYPSVVELRDALVAATFAGATLPADTIEAPATLRESDADTASHLVIGDATARMPTDRHR